MPHVHEYHLYPKWKLDKTAQDVSAPARPVIAPSMSLQQRLRHVALGLGRAARSRVCRPRPANRPQAISAGSAIPVMTGSDHAIGEEDLRPKATTRRVLRLRPAHRSAAGRRPAKIGTSRNPPPTPSAAEIDANAEPDEKEHRRAHGPALAPIGDGKRAASLRHGFDANFARQAGWRAAGSASPLRRSCELALKCRRAHKSRGMLRRINARRYRERDADHDRERLRIGQQGEANERPDERSRPRRRRTPTGQNPSWSGACGESRAARRAG